MPYAYNVESCLSTIIVYRVVCSYSIFFEAIKCNLSFVSEVTHWIQLDERCEEAFN